MDVVLGVSVTPRAPATIHTVLVAGENGDGVTVAQHSFGVATDDSAPPTTPSGVISAILRTRRDAATAGDRLLSTGVTWTDPGDADVLSEALAARGMENVMLVSAFLAAAALARAVGEGIGYHHIAMLFVAPEVATLGIVDCSDGAVTDLHRRSLENSEMVTELITLVTGLDEVSAQGLFLVGSGVDIALIKSRLETVTALAVSVPEEPQTALARGAALVSANAPLFASSTGALAYAQDLGTGAVDLYSPPPEYRGISAEPMVGADVAYSAVRDEEAEADTAAIDTGQPVRRPVLVAGSALAAGLFAAASALMIALALDMPSNLVALRPDRGRDLVIPAEQPSSAPPQMWAPDSQSQFGEIDHPPVAQHAPDDLLLPPLDPPVPVEPPAPTPLVLGPAPVLQPGGPAARPVPPVVAPKPLALFPFLFNPAPRAVEPIAPRQVFAPPAHTPASPVAVPTQVVKPDLPIVRPNPPVINPTPPVIKPDPPAVNLDPPVDNPTPPVIKPDPPAVNLDPPVDNPTPPVINPTPPVINPTPPVINPMPQLPVNPPSPEAPPVPVVPAPKAPSLPSLPSLPTLPVLRAPESPSGPVMPAPRVPSLPSAPAPQAPLPSMPSPAAPPSLPGSTSGRFGGGGFGGGNQGSGGFSPSGGFGSGNHSGGGFGGGSHSSGGFGGGGFGGGSHSSGGFGGGSHSSGGFGSGGFGGGSHSSGR